MASDFMDALAEAQPRRRYTVIFRVLRRDPIGRFDVRNKRITIYAADDGAAERHARARLSIRDKDAHCVAVRAL